MSRLTIYLLGPPRVELDHSPLSLSRRKALALLVYLAVEQQPQSRDSLATFFWPDYSQRDARTDLSRTLSHLNRTLGEGWLASDQQRIGMNPDANIWVDIVDFQHLVIQGQARAEQQLALLTTAVEHYQGDFMAGFALSDSPSFDDWHAFQTQSLQTQLAQALERLSQLHAVQGDFAQAIILGQRWLNLDPLHEPAHRQLMLLYAQADRHADALRQYQECERILRQDLDVAPDVETTQLFEALKSKRLPVSLVSTEPQPAKVTVGQSAVGENLFHVLPESERGVFVERDQELDQLHKYLTAALSGEGQVVFVTGEAGAGKTALVNEFTHRAQEEISDLLVAYGNCNAQTGGGDPYLPFRELISLLTGAVAHEQSQELIT
ncbi:AAA family ATPase [Chloroflexi bacterium TSY]|nr:AAA family ATPase [Chloroflexi bacterium TSY]